MSDKEAKIIYGCTLAVMVLAAITTLTLFPLRSSKTLRLSFVCLTNSEYFGPVSAFCASNTCDSGLSMVFYSPQTKIHGAWSQAEEQFLDIDGYLEPHQCVQFVVPTITNQMPWRVIVQWHYENASQANSLWSRIESRLPLNWLGLLRAKVPIMSEDSAGPVYDSYSQVMTNN